MNLYGIEFDLKNQPVLDPEFIPMGAFNRAFLITAKKSFAVAVERNDGLAAVFDTFIHGTEKMYAADCFYIERLVKLLLWTKGGYRLYICGDDSIGEYIKQTYSPEGKRAFDSDFMSKVYEKPFEVVVLPYDKKPDEYEASMPLGKHLNGCRIGFDAGGSDRKVSAVIDGEAVYSEEVIWYPKVNSDPEYHFSGILEALKSAASHMPRVDGIGISSAGIYIENRTMAASLFIKVPQDKFDEKVRDIYIRAAREIGDVPVSVANDGDITALAGAMELNAVNVLGIAMGTSEAGGYVDGKGNITGWLNELAFAPVDGQEKAAFDEWSGDKGCGVKYFSQDAVIRLAPSAGISLSENLSPAEKLKEVQKLMEDNEPCAKKIFESIGVYLGHSLAYYSLIYDIKHVLLLGRVMSGKGGNIIYKRAENVLMDEYPELYRTLKLHLPDEKSRRVGQSVAAASLPVIK